MAAACLAHCCWAFQCLGRSLILQLFSKECLTPGFSKNVTIKSLLITHSWFLVVRQRRGSMSQCSRFGFGKFGSHRKSVSHDSQPSYLLMDEFQVHLMAIILNASKDCGTAVDFISGCHAHFQSSKFLYIGVNKKPFQGFLLGNPLKTTGCCFTILMDQR